MANSNMPPLPSKEDLKKALEELHPAHYQHPIFKKVLESINDNDRLYVCMPPRHGRSMTIKEIQKAVRVVRSDTEE